MSPGKKYIWTHSGIYKDTIPAKGGCDSIITINLTIPVVEISVSQEGETLVAQASGASFRWLQCDDNYKVIANAVDQRFTPVKSGKYAVEVKQYNCVDTTGCYMVKLSGIPINTLGGGLEIYPNPSTRNIIVNLPEMYVRVDVELKDLLGRTLQKESYTRTEKLSLSFNEPKGLYFLVIRNNRNEMAVLKIVLE
jgi:hypothetical protein